MELSGTLSVGDKGFQEPHTDNNTAADPETAEVSTVVQFISLLNADDVQKPHGRLLRIDNNQQGGPAQSTTTTHAHQSIVDKTTQAYHCYTRHACSSPTGPKQDMALPWHRQAMPPQLWNAPSPVNTLLTQTTECSAAVQ